LFIPFLTNLFSITFLLFFICGSLFADGTVSTKNVVTYNLAENEKAKSSSILTKVSLPEKLVKLENELINDGRKANKIIFDKGAIYDEKEVLDYISAVGTRILSGTDIKVGEDVNFKLIRDPTVNAFALPDGTIYLHTGILSRLENEAQLAFTLAHEISHYANKDAVYLTDNRHNSTVVFKLVDIVLSPASAFFGILGDLANFGCGMIYVSSVTGYGKTIEARADKDAIILAQGHGYNPTEAASLIKVFMSENDKYGPGIEIYFLMNHPSNTQRLKKLEAIINERCKEENKYAGDINEEEFLHNMVKTKLYNALLNIKLDRLEHAHDNISWVINKYPDNAEAHYLLGEIYRLSLENKDRYKYEMSSKNWTKMCDSLNKEKLREKWLNLAIAEYGKAIEANSAYSDPYKGLGLLYYDRHDAANALNYLNKYIQINNQAPDKRYITNLISKIQ